MALERLRLYCYSDGRGILNSYCIFTIFTGGNYYNNLMSSVEEAMTLVMKHRLEGMIVILFRWGNLMGDRVLHQKFTNVSIKWPTWIQSTDDTVISVIAETSSVPSITIYHADNDRSIRKICIVFIIQHNGELLNNHLVGNQKGSILDQTVATTKEGLELLYQHRWYRRRIQVRTIAGVRNHRSFVCKDIFKKQ